MPVPCDTAPSKRAATCNIKKQSNLTQCFGSGFVFLHAYLLPHSSAPSHSLPCETSFSCSLPQKSWQQGSSSSTGTWSQLQLRAASADAPQLQPDGAEWVKPIKDNVLFPDPFNHLARFFRLSHTSARGQTQFDKFRPEATFVCPQSKLKNCNTHSSPAITCLYLLCFSSVPESLCATAFPGSHLPDVAALWWGAGALEQVRCFVCRWAGWRWGRYNLSRT